jgi:hypothetical protein
MMAVYRDIDSSVRIGGSLTLPAGSIYLSTITLNHTNGNVTATKFIGDGSSLTNLPIPDITNTVLTDGTRPITGTLTLNMANTHLKLAEAGVTKWVVESASGSLRILETGTSARLTFAVGGNATFSGAIAGTTINATSTLQENGINLSTKYEAKGTLHDDRYYTETETNTLLTEKAAATHTHAGSEITSAVNDSKRVVSTDTRDTNPLPNATSNGIQADFKANATDGLADGGLYHGVMTYRPYSALTDFTGGGPHQLGFTENGNMWYRKYSSPTAWGTWSKFWHAGNLTPISSTTTNQTVGSGFSVTGNLFLGIAPSTAGTLQIRNGTGKIAIELGTVSKGADAKVYIGNDGSADFDGNVEVQNLRIMDAASILVNNLNAEYLGGLKEYQLAKIQVHSDSFGAGVINGLNVTSLVSGTGVQLEVGVAYSESGKRIEVSTPTLVGLTSASSSNARYDVVYILGSKYANGSPTLSNEGTILVYEGVVAATPIIPLASLPQGAIPIAALYRLKAAVGGNTVVQAGDINMTVKKIRPINLLSTGVTIDRKLDITGELTATSGYFTGNISLINTNGVSLKLQGGLNDDTKPAFVALVEYDGAADHGFQLKYLGGRNVFSLASQSAASIVERLSVERSTGLVTVENNLSVKGTMQAAKNGKAVTVTAATTTAIWTHNYGATTYVVNLTSNSFARHVRWTNKTANTITIEIDDVYNEDILVDCILIGY